MNLFSILKKILMPLTTDFPVVSSLGTTDYVTCLVNIGGGIYKDRRVLASNIPDFSAMPVALAAGTSASTALTQSSVALNTANLSNASASNAIVLATAANGTAQTALGTAAAVDAKTVFSSLTAVTSGDYLHFEDSAGNRRKITPVDLLANGTTITAALPSDTIPIVHAGGNCAISVSNLMQKPVLYAESQYKGDNYQLGGAQGAVTDLKASHVAVDTVAGYDGTNAYTPGVAGLYRVVTEAVYSAYDFSFQGHFAALWAGVARNGIPVDLTHNLVTDLNFNFNGTQPSKFVRCETVLELGVADTITPFGMFTRQDSNPATSLCDVNRVKFQVELLVPTAGAINGVARETICSNLRAYWAEDFSGKIIAEWDCSGTGAFGTSRNMAYVRWGNTAPVAFATQYATLAQQSGTLVPPRIAEPVGQEQYTPYQQGAWDSASSLIYVVGDTLGIESTPWLITHVPYGVVV